MLGILPSPVLLHHTMPAGAISQANSFCFRSKENTVLRLHPFARLAAHRTINFKPGITSKLYLMVIEQLFQLPAAGKSDIA